jgi:hypothetical protein
MTSYGYTVTREGKWWMVEIPDIDGLTQARRLGEAEDMARDYVAVSLDVPRSSVDVRCTAIVVDGADVLARQQRITELHERAQRLEEESAKAKRALARELVEDEVPLRDVGSVVGLSHQRVSQLLAG